MVPRGGARACAVGCGCACACDCSFDPSDKSIAAARSGADTGANLFAVFDCACSELSLREWLRLVFGGGDFRRGEVGHDGELVPFFVKRSLVPSITPSMLTVDCRGADKARCGGIPVWLLVVDAERSDSVFVGFEEFSCWIDVGPYLFR